MVRHITWTQQIDNEVQRQEKDEAEEEEEEEEERRRTAHIKSNNPHLTGGEKWDFPFKMAISLDNQVSNYFQTGYTVDGRNPANQFSWVVIYQFSLVVIYKVVYIPGGAGYLPSTL